MYSIRRQSFADKLWHSRNSLVALGATVPTEIEDAFKGDREPTEADAKRLWEVASKLLEAHACLQCEW